MLRPGLVIALLLSSSACAYHREDHFPMTGAEGRLIISSSINEKNEPMDNLAAVKLQQKLFAAFVTLYRLDEGPHVMTCRFLNNKGEVALIKDNEIPEVKNAPVDRWCGYEFRPYDEPGLWRVQIQLDGRTIADRRLAVSP